MYKYKGPGATDWLCLNCDSGVNLSDGDGIVIAGTAPDITISAVDESAVNETNTSFAVGGGNLTITDPQGSLSVPVTSIAPDQSAINEAQTLSVSGSTNPTVSLNAISGVGGGSVQLQGGGGTTVTRSASVVTISSTSAAVTTGNTASRPSPTTDGALYYNTTSDQLNIADGTEWLRAGNWDFYGVVRYVPADSSWQILDDTDHTPYHLTSVSSTKTGQGFTVNLATSGRRLGTAFFLSDESLGGSGIIAGTSVGLTSVNCRVVHTSGFSLRMSGTSTIVNTSELYPRDVSFTWDGTNQRLTISHPSVGATTGGGAGTQTFNLQCLPTTGANWFYARPVAGSVDRGTSQWEFYNSSGTKVTPTGAWYYSRIMPWLPSNDSLSGTIGTLGNFWLFGRFAKDE